MSSSHLSSSSSKCNINETSPPNELMDNADHNNNNSNEHNLNIVQHEQQQANNESSSQTNCHYQTNIPSSSSSCTAPSSIQSSCNEHVQQLFDGTNTEHGHHDHHPTPASSITTNLSASIQTPDDRWPVLNKHNIFKTSLETESPSIVNNIDGGMLHSSSPTLPSGQLSTKRISQQFNHKQAPHLMLNNTSSNIDDAVGEMLLNYVTCYAMQQHHQTNLANNYSSSLPPPPPPPPPPTSSSSSSLHHHHMPSSSPSTTHPHYGHHLTSSSPPHPSTAPQTSHHHRGATLSEMVAAAGLGKSDAGTSQHCSPAGSNSASASNSASSPFTGFNAGMLMGGVRGGASSSSSSASSTRRHFSSVSNDQSCPSTSSSTGSCSSSHQPHHHAHVSGGSTSHIRESHPAPPPTVRKKQSTRDPLSHRMIEKRRRDRMNNCLTDLSRLIPNSFIKKQSSSLQNRGRIEKTEIIEMSIKYLHYLQEICEPLLLNDGPNGPLSMSTNTAANATSATSSQDDLFEYCRQQSITLAAKLMKDRFDYFRLGFKQCMMIVKRILADSGREHLGARLLEQMQLEFDSMNIGIISNCIRNNTAMKKHQHHTHQQSGTTSTPPCSQSISSNRHLQHLFSSTSSLSHLGSYYEPSLSSLVSASNKQLSPNKLTKPSGGSNMSAQNLKTIMLMNAAAGDNNPATPFRPMEYALQSDVPSLDRYSSSGIVAQAVAAAGINNSNALPVSDDGDLLHHKQQSSPSMGVPSDHEQQQQPNKMGGDTNIHDTTYHFKKKIKHRFQKVMNSDHVPYATPTTSTSTSNMLCSVSSSSSSSSSSNKSSNPISNAEQCSSPISTNPDKCKPGPSTSASCLKTEPQDCPEGSDNVKQPHQMASSSSCCGEGLNGMEMMLGTLCTLVSSFHSSSYSSPPYINYVPVFALHPSGQYYVPMRIESSILGFESISKSMDYPPPFFLMSYKKMAEFAKRATSLALANVGVNNTINKTHPQQTTSKRHLDQTPSTPGTINIDHTLSSTSTSSSSSSSSSLNSAVHNAPFTVPKLSVDQQQQPKKMKLSGVDDLLNDQTSATLKMPSPHSPHSPASGSFGAASLISVAVDDVNVKPILYPINITVNISYNKAITLASLLSNIKESIIQQYEMHQHAQQQPETTTTSHHKSHHKTRNAYSPLLTISKPLPFTVSSITPTTTTLSSMPSSTPPLMIATAPTHLKYQQTEWKKMMSNKIFNRDSTTAQLIMRITNQATTNIIPSLNTSSSTSSSTNSSASANSTKYETALTGELNKSHDLAKPVASSSTYTTGQQIVNYESSSPGNHSSTSCSSSTNSVAASAVLTTPTTTTTSSPSTNVAHETSTTTSASSHSMRNTLYPYYATNSMNGQSNSCSSGSSSLSSSTISPYIYLSSSSSSSTGFAANMQYAPAVGGAPHPTKSTVASLSSSSSSTASSLSYYSALWANQFPVVASPSCQPNPTPSSQSSTTSSSSSTTCLPASTSSSCSSLSSSKSSSLAMTQPINLTVKAGAGGAMECGQSMSTIQTPPPPPPPSSPITTRAITPNVSSPASSSSNSPTKLPPPPIPTIITTPTSPSPPPPPPPPPPAAPAPSKPINSDD